RIPPELESDPRGGVFSYQPPKADKGNSRLAVAIPVDLGADVRLIIGRDIEDQRLFADSVRRAFLLGFGVLSLIGLLGGLALSRLIFNRIEPITGHSRSIMSGDLSRRLDDVSCKATCRAAFPRAEAAANSMRWPEISTRCSTASKA